MFRSSKKISDSKLQTKDVRDSQSRSRISAGNATIVGLISAGDATIVGLRSAGNASVLDVLRS